MALEQTFTKLVSVVEDLSNYLDELDEEEEESDEATDKYIEIECCFYLAKTALEKIQPFVE